jgi:hypothetical protein
MKYHPNDLLNKRIRTCWHEIGHYVAACYNQQYFGGHGTAAIWLDYIEDGNDYEGNHKPQEPPGYVSNDSITHPASLLAGLAYGCIFQAILAYPKFKDCWQYNGNGAKDINHIYVWTDRVGMYAGHKGPVHDCILAHFEYIQFNVEFQPLQEMDIAYLVQSEENKVLINLKTVEELTKIFLPLHEHYYTSFVAQLEGLLEPFQ